MEAINPIWLLLASGALALVPFLLAIATSYLKVSIVIGMLKTAIGTQHTPGPLVVMSLSLALTLYIMAPVAEKSLFEYKKLGDPELKQSPKLESVTRYGPVVYPWIKFMDHHASSREKEILTQVVKEKSVLESTSLASYGPKTRSEALLGDLKIIAPAFVLTELREAFTMGFVLLLPFLVVDLITANILVGLGMYMVSPVMISLPIKLILFVVSDGWLLLTRALVESYNY